jgi:hypothetical protein
MATKHPIPLYNAKGKVTVKITAEDIKKAKRKDAHKCAAALACLRQVPHCTDAEIGTAVTILTFAAYGDHKARRVRFRTPPSFVRELTSFDRSGKMAPVEVTFAPRQPSHQPSGKRMGGPSTRSTGVKRPPRRRIAGIRAPITDKQVASG